MCVCVRCKRDTQTCLSVLNAQSFTRFIKNECECVRKVCQCHQRSSHQVVGPTNRHSLKAKITVEMASYSSPLHLNVNDMVDLPTKAEISISFRDVGCYFFCDHTLEMISAAFPIVGRAMETALMLQKFRLENRIVA